VTANVTDRSPNLRTTIHVLLDMDTTHITFKFEKLGARATIRPLVRNRWRPAQGPVVIDIGDDRHGEFSDIQANDDADVEVLDVQARDRHLLLMVRQPADRPGNPAPKTSFCAATTNATGLWLAFRKRHLSAP